MLTFCQHFYCLYFLAECPAGRHLSYNGNESVCLDIMTNSSCQEMNAKCQALYGTESKLLQIVTNGMLEDALKAIERLVYKK